MFSFQGAMVSCHLLALDQFEFAWLFAPCFSLSLTCYLIFTSFIMFPRTLYASSVDNLTQLGDAAFLSHQHPFGPDLYSTLLVVFFLSISWVNQLKT